MRQFAPQVRPTEPPCSAWCFTLFGLLAGLSLSGSAHAGPNEQEPQKKKALPNFILCMADDQGWGDVGYNGHPVLKTPVLDEMARTGLRFDRFYAAHPVCSPTRGSVLTGRNPNRFACFSWGHTLRPQEITVAEVLQRAGYATGHFGKWHLGPVRADSPVSPGNSGFERWASSPNFYENSPLLSQNGNVIETEGEGSLVTMQLALDFIQSSSEAGKPFLAVIWFGSPHSPHVAVEEEQQLYRDQPGNKLNYYGEITAMDRAMGQLRSRLREWDIADNTLLWYTSDNGPQGPSGPGSAGGLRGRKASLWEGGIRVPTIIEWPARIPQPRSTELPCSTVDIYPTLLDIANVAREGQPPLDGISLLPLLNGEMQSRRKPLGFWVYPVGGKPVRSHDLLAELRKEQQTNQQQPLEKDPNLHAPFPNYPRDEFPGHAAWIDGNWKLHQLPGKGDEPNYELYNLAKTPDESANVAEDHPDRVQTMKQQLQDWQRSVLKSLNGEDYGGE